MKFFEELLDKTTKFADEAVKVGKEAFEQTKVVAGDAMEKGKKKVNQLQLEADRKEALRKLGEVVYLQHKTGEKSDELVKQYVDEVSAIEADLELLLSEDSVDVSDVNENMDYTVTDFSENDDTLKEELLEAKEEITAELKEVVEEVKEFFSVDTEEKTCPSCGRKADAEDIFCRECGNKLN